MTSNKAVIFYNPPKVEATLLQGVKYNTTMFHKDLKIFRGVDNNIAINLKDADRRAFKVLDRDLKCIIVNPYNHTLMLVRYLRILDEQKGIYELKLTPGDIEEWSAGFYHFSITLVDPCDGSEQLFFTTLDQDVTGRLELIEKPFPTFTPSKVVHTDDFTMVHTFLAGQINNPPPTGPAIFVSSRFPGDAQKDYHDGLQTFSILWENYTGTFWVQGSLENNPSTDADWFNISVDMISDVMHPVNANGISVYNFIGNYPWIRFRHQPSYSNTGKIVKIIFKA